MPRPLLIGFEGAICPVINRRDRREPIFREDADRKRFLESLGEVCAKTGWRVHARCLMGNRFHLAAETAKGIWWRQKSGGEEWVRSGGGVFLETRR